LIVSFISIHGTEGWTSMFILRDALVEMGSQIMQELGILFAV
jgi:hypothetical protein